VSGKAFTLGEVDYLRLAQTADGASTQAVLDNMKTSSGYNTVRVFIDPGEFTDPSHGISTGMSSKTHQRGLHCQRRRLHPASRG
jgi:hypothetical protein